MQAQWCFALVVTRGAANIQPMIGTDNQAGSALARWLERGFLAAGGLGLVVLGIVRVIAGEGLAYPQSLVWMLPCALLAAGCTLLYWRVATRMPRMTGKEAP
ncbi:MAG TPA: hypothetical protein DF715_00090 [Oceanicaulis sp.]|nr:hypothetical protein [Oceanicaulis sp.]